MLVGAHFIAGWAYILLQYHVVLRVANATNVISR